MAGEEASWDTAEMATLLKAADDDLDLSHPKGDSAEELAVPDPVSAWLSLESLLLFFPKERGKSLHLFSSDSKK